MADLLSPRLGHLIVAGVLLVAMIPFAGCRLVKPSADLQADGIRRLAEEECRRIENRLGNDLERRQRRSDELEKKFRDRRLQAADFRPREALLSERQGIITGYFGEIYYYKFTALPVGGWQLLNKNQDLYYIRRVDQDRYYLAFFMTMDIASLSRQLRYPYAQAQFKYLPENLPPGRSEFFSDPVQGRFVYNHFFANLNNQLVLELSVNHRVLLGHFQRQQRIVMGILLAVLALMLLTLAYWAPFRAKRWVWWVMKLFAASLLLVVVTLIFVGPGGGDGDLFITLGSIQFRSIFQVLAILLFLFYLMRMVRQRLRFRNPWLAIFLFNVLLPPAVLLAGFILKRINFSFANFEFSLGYLGLLLTLALLLGLPPVVAIHFLPERGRRWWLLLLVQLPALWLQWQLLKQDVVMLAALNLLWVLFMAMKRDGVVRLAGLILMALAITRLFSVYLINEKRDFIATNLQNVFSSQGHYAKLVAREIVYGLNSLGKPFHEFFTSAAPEQMELLWKNSLAARESHPSGIFILSPHSELLYSYSYQIPYIPIKNRDPFPFWHVEEVYGDLFGRPVALAVASIDVFRSGRHLGTILVEVVNSAELVLKDTGSASIFTINPRLKGTGLGYVKINEDNQIVENPANIHFTDLAALLQVPNRWVRFATMGVGYQGFVFQYHDDQVIIFYPERTLFKEVSDGIKTFLFLLLVWLLLRLPGFGHFQWPALVNSFSSRVFFILIMITILTTILFSVFSLNFHFQELDKQLNQVIFERGRTAQNIINSLLAESGEITQNHLFLLAGELDSDICVYENGILLYASNHRRIIRSEIPIYLNSFVRSNLESNRQQFELVSREPMRELYFRVPPGYIFALDFAGYVPDLRGARQYYLDFMLTLFFIMVSIGSVAARFFRNRILAPINRLNQGMADVEMGRLEPLPYPPVETELRNLYQGFNAMIEGIGEQKKNISELSRMKTLIQLGRKLAHEIKNPLTPIQLSAEQILRSLDDRQSDFRPTVTRAVNFIFEETEHLKKVAHGFLDLSKLEELKPELFDLQELISIEVVKHKALYGHIDFVFEAPPAVAVRADRLKIKQVLRNLLANAVEAIANKPGRIEIELTDLGDSVTVTIKDNGPGMKPNELDMLFNENYSSKEMGIGLGLIIVKRVMELHRGSVEIVSQPNRGTTVTLRLNKNVPQA